MISTGRLRRNAIVLCCGNHLFSQDSACLFEARALPNLVVLSDHAIIQDAMSLKMCYPTSAGRVYGEIGIRIFTI
jgi:hypothetical protein